MKKLYRKGTVHPSPPVISDHLSFLPAAILTLTVALSPQDREVLAYLISSNNTFSPASNPRRTTTTTVAAANSNNNCNNQKLALEGDHPPLFHCRCFRCYMSYWVRWDSSPNHQLIHEIIDAYEDWLARNSIPANTKTKMKKKDKRTKGKSVELKRPDSVASPRAAASNNLSEPVGETSNSGSGGGGGEEEEEVREGGDVVEGEEEKGSVRRFVSFIGERIWGGWGQ